VLAGRDLKRVGVRRLEDASRPFGSSLPQQQFKFGTDTAAPVRARGDVAVRDGGAWGGFGIWFCVAGDNEPGVAFSSGGACPGDQPARVTSALRHALAGRVNGETQELKLIGPAHGEVAHALFA
jgi:hypothetical protein